MSTNDRDRVIHVGQTGWTILVLFLVVKAILVLLSVTHLHPYFFALARATGHFVNVNLVSFAVIAIVCVGGILMAGGGLRLRHLGLRRDQMLTAAITTACVWVILQVVLLLSAISGGDLRIHEQWADPGTIPMIGFFIAMLLGAALVEEVSFRGYVFPEIWSRLGGTYRRRVVLAAVVSQLLFALMHIPTRVFVGGHSLLDLVPSLSILTFAGLYGVAMYLRTGNLLVVIGIHALINAPSPIVATSFPPMVVVVILGLLALAFWPKITGSDVAWHRMELAQEHDPTCVPANRQV